ncbi:MAG: FAD-dependent oxidoreductase [Actinobacteria bacterium]|nr:FAD-dependent oxidoreductase [Actinomycetota bacterium]
MRTIVVVGASLAGVRAAATLRAKGFDGRLVLVGDEQHEPYDRPPLSKQFLAGEWDAGRVTLPDATPASLDVERHRGTRAVTLDVADRRVDLDDGEQIRFDGLVVATGATPRRLPSQPELPGVHVLRTLDDALALRADLERTPGRVVVVGAGFIGAEVAATCRGRGLPVTLVEALPLPLARVLGETVGRVVAAVHSDHGVDLRLGVGVEGFVGTGRVEGLRLGDGTSVRADVVVVGIGVAPTTGWLEGSGLRLADGVVCDPSCVAADGIVAAGDVARWAHPRYGSIRVEHWENAIAQGEHAAARLLAGSGPGEPFSPVPWFWSDQYDRKLQAVGRPSAGDEVVVVDGSLAERRFVALYGRDGVVQGAVGMNRPSAVVRWRDRLAEPVGWDEAVAGATPGRRG